MYDYIPMLVKDEKFYMCRDSILYVIDSDLFINLFKNNVFRFDTLPTCTNYFSCDGDLILVHQKFKIKPFTIYDFEFERIMNGET